MFTSMSPKPRRDEGSIDRQPDGRYLVRLQYTNAAGKRTSKKRLAASHELAKTKLRELRDEIARDLSDRKTFRELDAFYRREYVHAAKIQDGRKVSGFKQKTGIVEMYLDRLLNYFGDRPIDSIAFADLLAYKKLLLATPTIHDRPRSVADVNQTLRRLRRLLNVAVEQGWLNANPFNRGKGLIADSHETERTTVLSEKQEAMLLAVCCSPHRKHLRPLVMFAIDTAARRGEIEAVKWSDVNFDARSIRVKNKTRNVETSRLVPMPARLEKELAKLRQNVLFANSLVFDLGDFKKAWKSACDNAGLDGLHFHDLRHTGITRWLERGVSISDAMKASGHTVMKTFMRYVNQHESSMASFAEKLDKAA
jgi:integrase